MRTLIRKGKKIQVTVDPEVEELFGIIWWMIIFPTVVVAFAAVLTGTLLTYIR